MSERVREAPLSVEELMTATESDEAGAVVVFGGTVRRENEGKAVTAISYTAYEPLAERTFAELEQTVLERFPVTACRIVHRVGALEIGELSVLVVVRAPHRGDAFEAARYAIDTLKKTAPVWKREAYSDGTEVYLQGETLPGAGH
jgi:molybdopterin synthase catalytic subunit